MSNKRQATATLLLEKGAPVNAEDKNGKTPLDYATGKSRAAIAELLRTNQEKILSEIADVQGQAADIGGYYHPDRIKVDAVMRPSQTFNSIIAG